MKVPFVIGPHSNKDVMQEYWNPLRRFAKRHITASYHHNPNRIKQDSYKIW